MDLSRGTTCSRSGTEVLLSRRWSRSKIDSAGDFPLRCNVVLEFGNVTRRQEWDDPGAPKILNRAECNGYYMQLRPHNEIPDLTNLDEGVYA